MDDIPESYSRFPRTLDEAFRTARYADPIEPPSSHSWDGRTGYPPAWWAALGIIGALALTIAWVTR